ncbi:MAG: adenosylmethionine decarboxylase [Candidatus Nezhaarchaeota archaeon]|nr:adenosylmethionine decarboxylase [Candidatus Nezhaarchaeota archaeon]
MSTQETCPVKQVIGKHVYGNLYDCDPKALADEMALRRIVREAVEKAHCTLHEVKSWSFGGELGGVSVIALITESHIAIHTWVKYGYAAVDVYTCGLKSDPNAAFEYIVSNLNPKEYTKHSSDRSSKPILMLRD